MSLQRYWVQSHKGTKMVSEDSQKLPIYHFNRFLSSQNRIIWFNMNRLKPINLCGPRAYITDFDYNIVRFKPDTVPKSSDFDKHHICIFYGFTPMLF
jgi:hypothetical protein